MREYLRVKTTDCRVGVVGQYNAGKTVLLTSLISHLADHDPDRFELGRRGTLVRKYTPLPPDPGTPAFDHVGFRNALVTANRWPEKTCDRALHACQFERTDWTFSDVRLKLFDLPGERIADAAMLGQDYPTWSTQTLRHLHTDANYRHLCAAFLSAVERPDATAEELVTAYKRALAELILHYKPLISPSTFLLDKSGGKARGTDAGELAASRHSGLDAGRQFVPLPAGHRLAAAFAEHYQSYQTEVVEQFLGILRSCHALIVLVDVPMILAGGVGMYNDNRQMLHDLFTVLKPGETALQSGLGLLSKMVLPVDLRPAWISRVAFVAPKIDLVHPTDRDRVATLVRRLVGPIARDQDGLTWDVFNVSAAVSTKPMPAPDRSLVGIPLRDADGRKLPSGVEQRFQPATVPDDWPHDWQPGEYLFPEVYPKVSKKKDAPPDQIGLDRVLTFLLG